MQTKLTLRLDDAVIRKAKKIARKRGTSVSRIFSDYISEAEDEEQLEDLGEITASMIGALRGVEIEAPREEYRNHLEKKYL
jgi:predicted transcriptional regulator